MDDGGHGENARHKDHFRTSQSQWTMAPMHQMKDQQNMMKFMSMISERDTAMYERNLALSEKKAALAERDVAILQRDAAIAERDHAIAERDTAKAALDLSRQNAANGNPGSSCHGCSNCRRNTSSPRQLNRQQQMVPAQLSDVPYDHSREIHFTNAQPVSVVPVNIDMKPQGLAKRPRKDGKGNQSKKTPSATSKKGKRGPEDLERQVIINNDILLGNKPQQQHDWKGQDLGLNNVSFDKITMPVPGCSCTGIFRQCYKWGNGGWQSSCCTMSVSMYPLPMMANKRHSRVGGRKMSGSAFSKLLSRLASQGHDLSVPLDLKGHWARHGTNRYLTIR